MDLATRYLGLDLPHPFMPGASPLVDSIDAVLRVDGPQVFVECGSPLGRIEAINSEEFLGPKVIEPGGVERPGSHAGESLSFGEIELPSS